MEPINFCTDHRLGDTLSLQLFILRHHLIRRAVVLAAAMLAGVALITVTSGAPVQDSLEDLSQNVGRYLVIFVVGLLAIHAIALVLAWLAWQRRPRPRKIRAIIGAESVTFQKDGFSYGARWADADLLTESRTAFLMKFNQLYMRLPKRGFPGETLVQFRDLARSAVPAGANKLRA